MVSQHVRCELRPPDQVASASHNSRNTSQIKTSECKIINTDRGSPMCDIQRKSISNVSFFDVHENHNVGICEVIIN